MSIPLEKLCLTFINYIFIATCAALVNSSLWLIDPAESNGVFDMNDRDFMSVQNSSLLMTDSESSICDINKSALPTPSKRMVYMIGEPSHTLLDNDFKSPLGIEIERLDQESKDFQDWREEAEPDPPKPDSFLSCQVPIKESLTLNLCNFQNKMTLAPSAVSYKLSKMKSRMGSARSMNTMMKKKVEIAKSHLSQNFGAVHNQENLTDLPPEEPEDTDVERIRGTKQRESIRRERDQNEKQELHLRNAEAAKQHKMKTDKLMKKNHTYDYNGGIIFIRKPLPEMFPNEFDITKISKKSLKKTFIPRASLDQSSQGIVQKYFSKSSKSLPPEKEKKTRKTELKVKNYKGMENRVTPGGSNFESISAAAGVSVTEGGKNKVGKLDLSRLSQSIMTRAEYLNNVSSQSFIAHNTSEVKLPGLRDNQMDATIGLNSTIKSSRQGSERKLNHTQNFLPAIDASNFDNTRFGNYTDRNTSLMQTISRDKINMKDNSKVFIEKSLIIKDAPTKNKKHRGHMKGSKSMSHLVSLLPNKTITKSNFATPRIALQKDTIQNNNLRYSVQGTAEVAITL